MNCWPTSRWKISRNEAQASAGMGVCQEENRQAIRQDQDGVMQA